MTTKSIELNPRKAAFLNIAIREMGGNYLRQARRRGVSSVINDDCEKNLHECLDLAKRIIGIFGIESASRIDHENEDVMVAYSQQPQGQIFEIKTTMFWE